MPMLESNELESGVILAISLYVIYLSVFHVPPGANLEPLSPS